MKEYLLKLPRLLGTTCSNTTKLYTIGKRRPVRYYNDTSEVLYYFSHVMKFLRFV